MLKLSVFRGDITKLAIDTIVNAANSSLLGGGGVDGAIHRAAGPMLLEECRRLQGCATGEAKLTLAYNLPALYVIHTVGPIYSGKKEDSMLLASCYTSSLDLACGKGLHSIAFPAISCGVYGYPIESACDIALSSIRQWGKDNARYDMTVALVCFDPAIEAIYKKKLH